MVMASDASPITREDLARLSSDNSAGERARVAEKLTLQFSGKTGKNFTEKQIEIVEQIFRMLVKDAAVEVRKVLSQNLSESGELSNDIAKSLAMDENSDVSLPMIELSDVLTDEDLVEIIKTTESIEKQKAIAGREGIGASVTDALVETKNADVVTALMMNDKATIAEGTFTKAVDYFKDNHEVVEAMVTNGSISATVSDYIIQKVSQKIQDEMAKKYNTNFANINTFFARAREVVSMKMMGVHFHDAEMGRIVRGMQKDGSLTPLSGLCMGSLQIFYASLARSAKISIQNVKMLISDQGELGVPALLKASKVSERFAVAVRVLIFVLQQMQQENITAEADPKKFAETFIERIKTTTRNTRVDGMDFLINLIKHYADDKPVQQHGDF
ncbi:MAG: DUF2336 domain-containing protein [Proteobacteria bacterium]|nr:DUF2336 domain-containing protein [Pseudomonadota bacterium]